PLRRRHLPRRRHVAAGPEGGRRPGAGAVTSAESEPGRRVLWGRPVRHEVRARRRPATALTASLALLASGLAALGLGVATAPPAAAFPGPTVDLVGHGFGHGRGMGQFGALG